MGHCDHHHIFCTKYMGGHRSTEGSASPSPITVEKYQHLCQQSRLSKFIEIVSSILQKFIIFVLSAGPIPRHIAFIMDGNRRYEKKHNLAPGGGHSDGFLALMSLLKHCYLSGVKYVTVYAFSIDNFKRPAAEVTLLMNLMRDKIDDLLREESIVAQYGIRIHFIGNLKLLEDSVRVAAERAMRVTAENNNATLLICVAYTSTDEIIHAVEEACKSRVTGDESMVQVSGIEKHLYMSVVPEPDVVIRSSGESRLSNFLLWQTGCSLLHAPSALWPEMGFKDLCWSIVNFQRSCWYLERKQKQE